MSELLKDWKFWDIFIKSVLLVVWYVWIVKTWREQTKELKALRNKQ